MADTFVKIATVTVGSGGAANVTFSSIPATYTDLQLVLSGRGTTSAVDTDVTFSINSSTSNFSYRLLQGNGSAASSQNGSTTRAGFIPAATATASTFGSIQYYFPNYTSSNYKSISADTVNENNVTAVTMELDAILWSNTAAITSIALTPSAGNFAQYSTATLYGIKNS